MSDAAPNYLPLVVGAAGLLALTAGLVWNEYSAYQRFRDLAWAQEHIQATEAGDIDSDADGELVHMTGELAADGTRRDPVFNVETSAVRLDRIVEQREKTSSDEGVEYRWVRREVAGGAPVLPAAGRPEPGEPLTGATFTASEPTVGAHQLADDIVDDMDGDAIEVDSDIVGGFPDPLQKAASPLTTDDGEETACFRADPETETCGHGVGDVRVYWETFEQGPVSLYGKLDGETITEFEAPALDDTLGEITPGHDSATAMLEASQQDASIFLWAMRGFGTFATFFFGVFMFAGLQPAEPSFPLLGPVDSGGKVIGAGILTGLAIGITVIGLGALFTSVAL
jgi:hypothetical protein